MPNDVELFDRATVAKQLRNLAAKVESGQVSSYQITQDKHSVSFTADSADGRSRIIKKQHSINGLHRESSEHIEKAHSPKKRREVVAVLHAEGKTQVEIAKRTITSQKTISNDIRWLKEHGKI